MPALLPEAGVLHRLGLTQDSKFTAVGYGGTEPSVRATRRRRASITVTGDALCRATNVTNRLDTAAARAFLGQFVELP